MWRDPLDDIRRFEQEINRLFDDFWTRGPKLLGYEKSVPKPYRSALHVRGPYADVIETGKEVVVAVELPGVKKQDINIDATEGRIEVSAKPKQEAGEEMEGYFRRERGYGRFYRAIHLPASVDPERAKASLKNGVLEVRLPKVTVSKKTTVKIE